MKHFTFYKNQAGMITPLILAMAAIFIIFGVSLINWAITGHKDTVRKVRKIQSLEVAEAGVSYYKWHLAHNSSDYKDGNNWCCNNNPALTLENCGDVCGPYVHEYKEYDPTKPDGQGNVIGEFSLLITPPEIGSTVNTIESTGYAYGNNSVRKKVTALVGKRSLAEYSFLTNAPIWIGLGESTSGPLHSNGGIRFDDTCTAEVTSAVSTYNCAGTGHGCSGIKPGIWGSGGPTTLWRFPVPAIDFGLFTVSLADIKSSAAQEDGTCNGDSGAGRGICFDDSGAEGYLVKFLSDASINIYRVDTLMARVWYRNYEQGGACRREAEQIQNTTLLGNFDMPSNGLIFIGDDVWVEGTVNGKVTLAAARFPENPNNYARIRINNDIQYLARDGNHVLGLMAQGDIMVPKYAPTNLIIDATLLSQRGHVYYRNYSACGSGNIKNNIEVYGGIITNLFWTWSYTNGVSIVDGYNTTNTIYNNNLTFAPPPSFPTSENYEVLSWKEE